MLRARYQSLAKRAGFDRLFLSVSFDCDTDRDASCALEVDEQLETLGFAPSYAVPGELLLRNLGAYSQLAKKGREFLNHGFKEHTIWDQARRTNISTFFYDQATLKQVQEDIESGDRTLSDSFGLRPNGFRSPHFGTFQSPRQLRFLHGLLSEMGYRYSSSTLPAFGIKHGPICRHHGVLEIPVMGTFSRPLRIYDSWSFFEAPKRRWKPSDFKREAELWLDSAQIERPVGLINLYGDPSQVHDRPEFFEALKLLAQIASPIRLGDVASRPFDQ